MNDFILQKEGFYSILPMKEFRKTPGVEFHVIPKDIIPRVDGVDRVIHQSAARSPGSIAGIDRPWYMHPYQDDNLLVLAGKRIVDIYHLPTKKLLTFQVTPEQITFNGDVICNEPAILVWPCGVFHRITSGFDGSTSLNLATRYDGFNISTNFSIYNLDTDTGKYEVIRKGDLDQP